MLIQPLVFGERPPSVPRTKRQAEDVPNLTFDLSDEHTEGQQIACNPNPCVVALGLGPAGATCKTCIHLERKRMGKTYLKCALRENTNGPATDHKAGWDACAKYEVETPSQAAPLPTVSIAPVQADDDNDEDDTFPRPWWIR